jgi:hypothetical protein
MELDNVLIRLYYTETSALHRYASEVGNLDCCCNCFSNREELAE